MSFSALDRGRRSMGDGGLWPASKPQPPAAASGSIRLAGWWDKRPRGPAGFGKEDAAEGLCELSLLDLELDLAEKPLGDRDSSDEGCPTALSDKRRGWSLRRPRAEVPSPQPAQSVAQPSSDSSQSACSDPGSPCHGSDSGDCQQESSKAWIPGGAHHSSGGRLAGGNAAAPEPVQRQRSWAMMVGSRGAPAHLAVPRDDDAPDRSSDSASSMSSVWEGPLSAAGSSDLPDDPAAAAAAPAASAQGAKHGSEGYRGLWSSISTLRRGDRLPASPAAPAEVTVDELVVATKGLSPGVAILPALESRLALIDSRAAAALLKELSRTGLGHRAAELMDSLRALPTKHPLSRLNHTYTYTTAISQCSSRQQLARALELVAEMRSRGIDANIHTYSALMSVCVKCNECDLALDVFEALQGEGLEANLVTYNILADIHAKKGAWERAVEVLDDIRSKLPAATPEARTFNTVLGACSRAAQLGAARAVYQRMIDDGVDPTGTTYTLLISAYGKAGLVDEAVAVFEDMVRRRCERNIITYGALICAAERAARADLAARLFDEMQRDGCRPNIVTFNALVGAHAQAGQWREAVEVVSGMQRAGCRPDAATHSTLLLAFERGGQWALALQELDSMQRQGMRIDACAYNAVIGALWGSGLAGAQLRAAQLAAAAHRTGQLRPTAGSSGVPAVIAHTPGAAVLVTLRWLWDLRGAALSSGSSQSLQLARGRHARSDQSFEPILEALRQLLGAFNAPVSVEANASGLLLRAEARTLAPWLAGPSAVALLSPVASAPGAPAAATAALLAADEAAAARCGQAFAAVRDFERSHALPSSAAAAATVAARVALASALVDVARTLGCQEETVHDALRLLDRALGAGLDLEPVADPAHCAFALLLLCSRQTGSHDQLLRSGALLFHLQPGLSLAGAAAAEEALLRALRGDAGAVSALRVLRLYLERLGCAHPEALGSQLCTVMALTAVDTVTQAALSPALVPCAPSAVAAAALAGACRTLGLQPHWPAALRDMTGYELDQAGGELQACLGLMAESGILAA